MANALTVYPNSTASGTLATANQLLANISGSGNTNKNTKVGTSTGYGEVWSQSNASAWPAAGGVSAPSGHGWLLDSTILEGMTIGAGNWTPTVRMAMGVGTMTADIIVRWYVRSSGGVYTAIGSDTLTAQSFTTTTTTYPLSATSLAATNFAVGDKLYYDLWLNITVNGSGSGTATVNASMASSATLGSVQILTTTPGFLPTGNNRIVPVTAALLATLTRNVPTSAALMSTPTRVVPATAALQATLVRNVPATAALLATLQRNVPASAALLATLARSVPATAALQSTPTRSVPASAALLATLKRNVPASAALLATLMRSVPSSAALLFTGVRVIPCTVALSAAAPTIPGVATLSDSARNLATLGDTLFGNVTLNDKQVG